MVPAPIPHSSLLLFPVTHLDRINKARSVKDTGKPVAPQRCNSSHSPITRNSGSTSLAGNLDPDNLNIHHLTINE
jgi:hypothetical protein